MANEESDRPGDDDAFSRLIDGYRNQLRVHCYRMVGSFDEAEDLVQETMLRAWRGRDSFEGRSLLRTWLYRIATNVCLNALERAPPRVMPQDVAAPVTATTPPASPPVKPAPATEVPWLQPYPDDLLEPAAPAATEPEAALAARETIGLAFIAALQHLPPKQRALLILCDVVGWSASEAAALLEMTVAAVTSALQRAHETMRARLSPGPHDWMPTRPVSRDEQAVLKQFMAAWEQDDADGITNLMREDARWAMPPLLLWFQGRGAIANMLRLFPPGWQGRQFRMVATAANRQPATAAYVRQAGGDAYRLSGLLVLGIDAGRITEVTTFGPDLCAAFRLPPVLPV